MPPQSNYPRPLRWILPITVLWFDSPSHEKALIKDKSQMTQTEREKFLYLDKTWDASSRFQGPLDEFTLFHPKTLCVALWNFESI